MSSSLDGESTIMLYEYRNVMMTDICYLDMRKEIEAMTKFD